MRRVKKAAPFLALILCAFLIGRAQADSTATRLTDTPRVPGIVIASVYSGDAPGANTDILAADVTPTINGSVFRVTVCLGTASVFNVVETDGTQAFTEGLNSSVALNAGDRYTFILGSTRTDNTYNFQVETDGVIRVLQVEEVVQESF